MTDIREEALPVRPAGQLPTPSPIGVLFIPSNPSHVDTMRPVAEELQRRGHSALFVIRDAVVDRQYHTAQCIDKRKFDVYQYSDYYKSDIGLRVPELSVYFRTKRAMFGFLGELDFSVLVTCNDSSCLFDRLAIGYARRSGRQAVLIQEGIRPAQRRLSWATHWKQRGLSGIADRLVDVMARRLTTGPYARRGYGLSKGTLIAVAGDRFRRQLIEKGVPDSRICVTGQPRLDGAGEAVRRAPKDNGRSERILLFCSQPLETPRDVRDQLFRDLVLACDALSEARLIVKLHPRDLPVEHWLGLLEPGEGSHLLEVTKSRPLGECFGLADAMVTVASTTSVEAMAAEVPVGLLNYLPTAWYLPYDEHGAVVSVKDGRDLRQSIGRLLGDALLRQQLVARSADVLRDELCLRDGRSASRIADLIEKNGDLP